MLLEAAAVVFKMQFDMMCLSGIAGLDNIRCRITRVCDLLFVKNMGVCTYCETHFIFQIVRRY